MAESSTGTTGPDLSRGVPESSIPSEGVLAGHVGEEPVLLSRQGAELFAVGGRCTHYGAPLSEGAVTGETVRCPWHHACFSLRTGAAVKAPAFDPLPRWRVEIEGDRVFVREQIEELLPTPSPSPGHPNRIVIVGGGAAGFAAAEMLRRLGFVGELTMLSADSALPCDRPNLSKDYLAGTAPEEWIPLKGEDFYQANRIDLRLGAEVEAIDTDRREVAVRGGCLIGFDALLLATGAEPVRLAGFDHPAVHTLRNLADARSIIAAAEGVGTAAILGSSFIGLEAAAALVARGLKVHVVSPDEVPMEKVLGREIGTFVRDLHVSKGVVFHSGRIAASFDGHTLMLDDGSTIETGLVVAGVGVRPRTALAEAAGIVTDMGVVVDDYLETSAPGIFAVGDIASYPDGSGGRQRIEHWVVAQRQGQVAARNMLGESVRYSDVPFFWSRHYDVSILYVGHSARWDEMTVDGSVADGDCTVRFLERGVLKASASIGRPLDSLADELSLERSASGVKEVSDGCTAQA